MKVVESPQMMRNTQMRHVHKSASEREGIQERAVCCGQVGPCRFVDETCKASEKKTVRPPSVSHVNKRSRRYLHG